MAPIPPRRTLNDSSRLLANRFLAVHPTVTLSIDDHHTRVAKGTSKRAVGTLLGEVVDGKMHATGSFAVPFEEDLKDPSIWYLDHQYLESMTYMFNKINRREKIIGWYSTGARIKPADLEINELMRRYTPNPVYLLVNVSPEDSASDLPFKAYMAVEEPSSDELFRRSFAYVASGVAQFEAEEVGVEHLLRDVEKLRTSTRGTKIADKLNGLKCLEKSLLDISAYLEDVSSGKLPSDPRILSNLQNLLNLSGGSGRVQLMDAFESEVNAAMLAVYMGSVVRSVLSLHGLVKNRLELKARHNKEEDVKKEPAKEGSSA